MHIIHGSQDEIVPLEGSRDYVDGAGPGVTLKVDDDEQSLVGSLPSIIAAYRELLGVDSNSWEAEQGLEPARLDPGEGLRQVVHRGMPTAASGT